MKRKPLTKKWKEAISIGVRKNWETKGKKSISDYKSWPRVRHETFKLRGRKCERCGWQEENKFHNIIPVQINHIDGNNKNHKPENLEILCPNCHSLTEFFMFYGRRHKT